MLAKLNDDGIFLKILFDGHDLYKSDMGKILIQYFNAHKLINYTYEQKLYDDANSFIDYCISKVNTNTYIPKELMQKYKVGLYSLEFRNDCKNPWKDKSYILFNHKILNQFYSKCAPLTDKIAFWVCPSFDKLGQCDGIGFRVVDQNKVLNAFKWLFMCGNNIIYGKNTVDKDKECYIVEGFRDYVALKECGYNAIGLGSVEISDKQKKYINTLKNPILLLDNDSFGLKKTLEYKNKYRIATLIHSKYKDAYDTYINNGNVEITEIK